MAYASGYRKTAYHQYLVLVETRFQWVCLALLGLVLAALPVLLGAFHLDLVNQVLLAIIGSVALMMLTGFAGLVSLGHAGLMAAGAFTTGILVKELAAPAWLTFPASGLVGAGLGFLFGLPSLRLKGLYLLVSTLALHFIVVFIGGEYESRRGFSTGIVIDSPDFGFGTIDGGRAWYGVLLAGAVGTVLFALNLRRSPTGRAWSALHAREVVAEALGIDVRRAKLAAFVISSTLTALSGSLFAYYRGFVAVEAFSLYLTIQYVAMIIIGGMGSVLGAILGAGFVVLFPYLVEAAIAKIPGAIALSNMIFAVNYAAFGLVMILFLLFEPQGLVGIWRRVQRYFLMWPFRTVPAGTRGG